MLARHIFIPRRPLRSLYFDVRRCESVLIANRGEIAIRIAQAAGELGIHTVGVSSQDDQMSLHCRRVDRLITLHGVGAAAYLDQSQIMDIAKANGCTFLHPGYGFLSENATFATLCATNGIKFIGPTPEQLCIFGDKGRARAVAARCGLPVIPGTSTDTTLTQAQDFYKSLPPYGKMIIKARSGGGGRGMRIVSRCEDIPSLYERCKSEAKVAFGDDSVYVEMFVPKARHIEVQIVGDGSNIAHLWERECRWCIILTVMLNICIYIQLPINIL
jgi:pyruvate carboxylase